MSPIPRRSFGSKTLIVTGFLSELPAGLVDRHQLLPKQLGHTEIVAAVRQAMGGPEDD